MCTTGGVVSTVQVYSAALELMFPAWSIAQTSKVCSPSPTTDPENEALQPAGVAPSSEHEYVDGFSLEWYVKFAFRFALGSLGPPSIDTVGGVRSTVQL